MPTLDEKRVYRVVEAKAEAERRILAVAPLWRQINLIRDNPADPRLGQIDAIRAASNAIESAINTMAEDDIDRLNVEMWGDWP